MSYLSIDLDYFNDNDNSLESFFKRVFSLNKPIFVAAYHDQLLPHINTSGCKTLINIDFHSDLLGEQPEELTEGSWVNYVRWKADGRYCWRHPTRKLQLANYCHRYIDPFLDEEHGGWKQATHRQGLNLYWPGIEAVGVCLSPAWVQWRDALRHIMYQLHYPTWCEYDCRLFVPFLLDYESLACRLQYYTVFN
jgi:hypothetical protein